MLFFCFFNRCALPVRAHPRASSINKQVLILLDHVQINIFRLTRKRHQWRLVNVPMDVYMVSFSFSIPRLLPTHTKISLFLANFLHGIGGMINTKWLHEGMVHSGAACWSQGKSFASSLLSGLNDVALKV
jgi:hypothetical protein